MALPDGQDTGQIGCHVHLRREAGEQQQREYEINRGKTKLARCVVMGYI